MKTTTLFTVALLTGACFADVPPSTGGDTSDSGTTTGASSIGEPTSGSSSGASSGPGSTTGTSGAATDSGSTGTVSGSTEGGTTGSGSTGGSSTGSTTGEPLFPDMYAPCEEHAECMSGVCVESFSAGQQDITHGFCSVLCDPIAANPCAGAENPFPGPAVVECFWHPDDDKDYCGIQCAGGCPVGWKCQAQADQMGTFGACFEEV